MSNPTPAARIYEDLIARLEKGEGSDRELDELILCKLAAPEGAYVEQSKINGEWCIYHGEWNGRPRLWEDRKWGNQLRWTVTSSLDAALSLVERILPGWQATSYFDSAELISPETGGPSYNGLSRNRARALLVALLRALQENPHGK